MAVWDATETVADVAVATTVVSGSSFFCFAVAVAETAAASETGRSFYRADMITGHGSLPRPVLFLFQIHLPADSSSAKGMHKGTSEAPVLSESERERRSKGISLWGEGKRKRFPLQPFAGEILRHF